MQINRQSLLILVSAIAFQVYDDSSHDNFSLKAYFNTIRKVVSDHNPSAAKR